MADNNNGDVASNHVTGDVKTETTPVVVERKSRFKVIDVDDPNINSMQHQQQPVNLDEGERGEKSVEVESKITPNDELSASKEIVDMAPPKKSRFTVKVLPKDVRINLSSCCEYLNPFTSERKII